jgi:hypothetical protein
LPPGVDNVPETSLDVSNLPPSYAIQQTITIQITRTGQLATGATFGGSGGVSIDPMTNAVPAPGGLVLAVIALPLIGLRRALRKRGEAAA